jgi:hypothetical protein
MMCETSGRCVNVGLLRPLLHFVGAHSFASSVVTLQGYKSKRSPLCTFFLTKHEGAPYCVFIIKKRFYEQKEKEKEEKDGLRQPLRLQMS